VSRQASVTAPAAGGPSLLAMPLKGFRKNFDVNLFAAFRLMQLVVPGMIEAGRGAIVNVSSDAAHRPGEGPYSSPGRVPLAYGGSKAALEHLTQAVAAELSPYGVTANAVLPSRPIDTPGLRAVAPDLVDADDVGPFAEAVVRLAAADASTTGLVIYHEDVLHPELGRRGWLGGV
jgi:7-alpha-hydroxysteroid dehydrogenase